MTPVLIAGGGLAGSAAAAALAAAGQRVTLIERETHATHKICGEFLSFEAQTSLQRLGLDITALGGHKIDRLVIAIGPRQLETQLPFSGIGITRRVLDEAMLHHAAACGAEILRGQAIKNIDAGSTISLTLADNQILHGKNLFLATGKHELRGLRRPHAQASNLTGFKMYFRLSTAAQQQLSGRIGLILFAGGYAGLQMVESGLANLCLLVNRERLQTAGNTWPGLLENLSATSPYLSQMLTGAAPMLERPLTITRVPYGYLHRPQAADHPGLYRLGDQAAVIASFTGDGMAIALHSAALATASHQNGKPGQLYHKRLAADLNWQMRRANTLYRLASWPAAQPALFKIMRAWPQVLRIAATLTRIPEKSRVAMHIV